MKRQVTDPAGSEPGSFQPLHLRHAQDFYRYAGRDATIPPELKLGGAFLPPPPDLTPLSE